MGEIEVVSLWQPESLLEEWKGEQISTLSLPRVDPCFSKVFWTIENPFKLEGGGVWGLQGN